jgi:hypothetical protein
MKSVWRLVPGALGGRLRRPPLSGVNGESPSPQTTKSVNVFAGLCLIGLTFVQMSGVWDDGHVAPAGTGWAQGDEAAAAGCQVAVGQIAGTNDTNDRYKHVECRMTRAERIAAVDGRLSGKGA